MQDGRRFRMPEPIDALPWEAVLARRLSSEHPFGADFPSDWYRHCVGRALGQAAMRNLELWMTERIIDAGASEGYASLASSVCPTLTRQGASRLWSLTRGRFLTIGELAGLQGFDQRDFTWTSSRRASQVGYSATA